MPASKNKKPFVKKASSRQAVSSKRTKRRSVMAPHLVHPRHSFKLLPHIHTSYPMLAYMLLLVGIFCFGWTNYVSGDSYSVRAKIPAAPLTVAAQITAPKDGATIDDKVITVTGTCPYPSYVKLHRNDSFTGMALCTPTGEWSIQTMLILGENMLFAQDYNITDDIGPVSDPITITNKPVPVPAKVDPTAARLTNPETTTDQATIAAQKAAKNPLILTSDFLYKGVLAGDPFTQTFRLDGGKAPYAVSIDWGDGSSELSSHAKAGEFTLTHTYTQPSNRGSSYVIKVTVTDNDGQTALFQTAAIVTVQQTGTGSSGLPNGGSGTASSDTTGSTPIEKFWKVATPVYVVTVVSVASFWLGQRQELHVLHRQAVRMHRKRPV